MNAEDPLFILYTSRAATGQPKGCGAHLRRVSSLGLDDPPVHVRLPRRGHLLVYGGCGLGYRPQLHRLWSFGQRRDHADVRRACRLIPDAGRFWAVCEKHKVNQFYTAPTAIRALMGQGPEFVEKHDLSTLTVLGTVGEPINPEAWNWYNDVVGKGAMPDRRHLVADRNGWTHDHALARCHRDQAWLGHSAIFRCAACGAGAYDRRGSRRQRVEGVLAIKDSWPGQMRTVFGDHERFVATYFSDYKGYYFTGDGCRRDEDGYYWITGRVDDVINVSGHRMGTAEVESALVAHDKVAEAAVVGYPHDIKGQGIYCYVTLMAGEEPTDELRTELRNWVRQEIGPIASPDLIQWAPGLPKTRSGKIMRRILRKIAEDDFGSLGDTSTLAEPAVVDDLIANRMNK